jgi:uncharacterized membrane protein YfcA
MSTKNTKRGLSKSNLIIAIILLALVGFLFGTDALSWLGDTAVKLMIGVAILLIVVISIRSLNKRSK